MKVIIYTIDGNTVTLEGELAKNFVASVDKSTGELNLKNLVIKENNEIRCVIYKKWITHFQVKGA